MLKLFLKHVRRIFLDTLAQTINNLDSAELLRKNI